MIHASTIESWQRVAGDAIWRLRFLWLRRADQPREDRAAIRDAVAQIRKARQVCPDALPIMPTILRAETGRVDDRHLWGPSGVDLTECGCELCRLDVDEANHA